MRLEITIQHQREAVPSPVQASTALPPLYVELALGEVLSLGASTEATVRLPPNVAAPRHAEFSHQGPEWTYRAHAPCTLGHAGVATALLAAGDHGVLRLPFELRLGACTVMVRNVDATAATQPSSHQRTDSLARELSRGLLAGGAPPMLHVESGPCAGQSFSLPPPEANLSIGRGPEAGWQVRDDDISRIHATLERSWNGVRLFDANSKNGTFVDDTPVGAAGAVLRAGQRFRLGKTQFRYEDPVDATTAATNSIDAGVSARAVPLKANTAPIAPPTPTSRPPAFYIALGIGLCALLAGALALAFGAR